MTPAVPDQGSSVPAEGDGTVPDTGNEDVGDPGLCSAFFSMKWECSAVFCRNMLRFPTDVRHFRQNVFGNSGGTGIQVAVPEPEMELYAERLAGYEITLTK